MNNTLLIIQREYLTRVRKKSFIIMSIIGPLLFAAMMILPAWFASMEDTNEKVIAVIDETGMYKDALQSTDVLKFNFIQESSEEKSQIVSNNGVDALLMIHGDLLQNPSNLSLYSDGQVTIDVIHAIRNDLNRYLKDAKLASFQIEGFKEKLDEINNLSVNINTVRLDSDGQEKKSSAEFAMAIGMGAALLIYMFMLIYGTQVMRGVIEEKTNRIVEVIISSVKPFQLMMGKIIGIGLVAITQFVIWITLTLSIVFVVQNFVFATGGAVPSQVDAASVNEAGQTFNNIISIIKDSNIISLISFFVFYFIGGYLIYASLFAAIGSAIDNETETQQFVMPVMIPIILSIYVATAAMRNPHGDLAFWFSIIPLTSPVVMMSRLPFDVPAWQLALSMTVMVASFMFFTWFAARVYRTGILMYGKKVSYKEIWKWFIQAGK